MMIACPSCKAQINGKLPKPGKYNPKCPKCQQPFLLIVPEDVDLTVQVKMVPAPGSGMVPKPPPRVDPNQPKTGKMPPAAPKKSATVPNPSARPAPSSTEATGEFTAPARPKIDSHSNTEATGDFTPKKGPAREVTAEVTGAFTPGAGAIGGATEATGNFSPKADDEADRTSALPSSSASEADDGDAPTVGSKAAKGKKSKKAPAGDQEMPEQLGGYAVEKQLGKGGMGAVYLARQLSLDRQVALKVMNPEWAQDPVFLARFVREAYAAAQLNHHNVVSIYDIGEDKGINFFSMEFVEGKSLGDVLRKQGKIDTNAAVSYILQAARGLKFAHDRGMVHRDVKPDNMMLNTEGMVKVADLGLVKTRSMTPADDRPSEGTKPDVAVSNPGIRSVATAEVTSANSAMGSPSYMSPEQCRDAATVDQRADIYSLGCSLYALLAGRAPFQGDTALEVITRHLTDPPPPLHEVAKNVPKDLTLVVERSLAKEPRDRYQTMDEFIGAMKSWQDEQKAGPPKPTEEQVAAFEGLSAALANHNLTKLAGMVGTVLPLAGLVSGLLLLVLMPQAGAAILIGTLVGIAAGFILGGTLAGGYLFQKVREWVFGFRLIDMITAGLVLILFLAGVFFTGLIVPVLIGAVVGGGLGAGYAFGLVGPAARQRQKIKVEMESVLKRLRIAGMEEDAVRKFVVDVAADDWELVYETLFGFSAKMPIRAAMAERGESRPKHAAWREKVIGRVEAALQERASNRAKKRIQKLETKRLEAEGVSKADAEAQAADAAADLVEQGAEIRAANVDRQKKVDVSRVLTRYEKAKLQEISRPRKNPIQKLILGITRFVFAPRLRLLLGAALMVGGLMWLHQNQEVLLKPGGGTGDAAQQVSGLAVRLWDAETFKVVVNGRLQQAEPLKATAMLGEYNPFDSINPIVAGLLLVLTIFSNSVFAWLLVGVSSAIVLLGHKLAPMAGVPMDLAAPTLSPQQLSLAAGSALGVLSIVLFGRR